MLPHEQPDMVVELLVPAECKPSAMMLHGVRSQAAMPGEFAQAMAHGQARMFPGGDELRSMPAEAIKTLLLTDEHGAQCVAVVGANQPAQPHRGTAEILQLQRFSRKARRWCYPKASLRHTRGAPRW